MGIKRVKKMEIKSWIKSNSKLKNHGEEEEFFLFEREFQFMASAPSSSSLSSDQDTNQFLV